MGYRGRKSTSRAPLRGREQARKERGGARAKIRNRKAGRLGRSLKKSGTKHDRLPYRGDGRACRQVAFLARWASRGRQSMSKKRQALQHRAGAWASSKPGIGPPGPDPGVAAFGNSRSSKRVITKKVIGGLDGPWPRLAVVARGADVSAALAESRHARKSNVRPVLSEGAAFRDPGRRHPRWSRRGRCSGRVANGLFVPINQCRSRTLAGGCGLLTGPKHWPA